LAFYQIIKFVITLDSVLSQLRLWYSKNYGVQILIVLISYSKLIFVIINLNVLFYLFFNNLIKNKSEPSCSAVILLKRFPSG